MTTSATMSEPRAGVSLAAGIGTRAMRADWKDFVLPSILLLQTVLTLRLSNSAFRDEALYIWTGHREIAHWFHGAVLYDNPGSYFSGAPVLYPVWAAVLDRVGGLSLVRLFSLICMLVTTTCVFQVSCNVLGRRVACFASMTFALAGPTLFLGHLATFDAPSLAMLSLAFMAASRLASRGDKLRFGRTAWLVSVSCFCFVSAVALKYGSLLLFPFCLSVALCSADKAHRRRAMVLLGTIGIITVAVLGLLALTIARPVLNGLSRTTTARQVLIPESAWELSSWVAKFAGGVLLLAALGMFILMRRRRIVLAVATMLGSIVMAAYQIHIHERVSLQKHVGFSLIFAAILVGVVLDSQFRAKRWVSLGIASWILVVWGVWQSSWLFNEWPNTTELSDTIAYSVAADPYVHTLGDVIEPVRYALQDKSQYWNWDTTDSVYYKGLRGESAALKGIRDGYWNIIYLDGSSPLDGVITRQVGISGYRLTHTIRLRDAYGRHVYRVWERY